MLEQGLIEDAMRRALRISLRGPEPDTNPRVGCVLLDPEARIVAEGWHLGAGTPHAEIDALTQLTPEWQARASELTAVVTLEPCNHTGRTGPCAVALIEAGIGAVAYALGDPGQSSSGGAATLRDAGVNVRGGILPGEARTVLSGWFARQQAAASGSSASAAPVAGSGSSEPRPVVVVKWAQTLDGRAAATDGSSQWITGVDARGDVHRRRAEADAILVGTGTLIADDPALTSRAETGGLLVPAEEQPIPIIVGHRKIPAGSRVLQHPALAAHGLEAPIRIPGDDLAAELAELHTRGIRRVFVEGGPSIASALIAEGLADEVLVYLAPALLGGPKLALGDLGIPNIAGIKRLRPRRTVQLGVDLLIIATIVPEEEGI